MIASQMSDADQSYYDFPLLEKRESKHCYCCGVSSNSQSTVESAYWDMVKTVGTKMLHRRNGRNFPYALYNNPFDPRLIFKGLLPPGPRRTLDTLGESAPCRSDDTRWNLICPTSTMETNLLLCMGHQASQLLEHHTSRYRLYQQTLRSDSGRFTNSNNQGGDGGERNSHPCEQFYSTPLMMDLGGIGRHNDNTLHQQFMSLLYLPRNLALGNAITARTLSPIMSEEVRMLWLLPQLAAEVGTTGDHHPSLASAGPAVQRPFPMPWQSHPSDITNTSDTHVTQAAECRAASPVQTTTETTSITAASNNEDKPCLPVTTKSRPVDVHQEVKAGLEYLHNQHHDLLSAWKKALARRRNDKLAEPSSKQTRQTPSRHSQTTCMSTPIRPQSERRPSYVDILSSSASNQSDQQCSSTPSGSTSCRRRLWDDNDIIMVVDMDISPLSPQLKKSHSDPDLYSSVDRNAVIAVPTSDDTTSESNDHVAGCANDLFTIKTELELPTTEISFFPSIHTSDFQDKDNNTKTDVPPPGAPRQPDRSIQNQLVAELSVLQDTLGAEQKPTQMALNLNRMNLHPPGPYSTNQYYHQHPAPTAVIGSMHAKMAPVRMDINSQHKPMTINYGKPFVPPNSNKLANVQLTARPVAWNPMQRTMPQPLPAPTLNTIPVPHYPPPMMAPIMHTMQYPALNIHRSQRPVHMELSDPTPKVAPIFQNQFHVARQGSFQGPSYAQVAHGNKNSQNVPLCASTSQIPLRVAGTVIPHYAPRQNQHISQGMTHASVIPQAPIMPTSFPNYPPPPSVDFSAALQQLPSSQNKSWLHTRMPAGIRKDSPPTSAAKLYSKEATSATVSVIPPHTTHTFASIVGGNNMTQNMIRPTSGQLATVNVSDNDSQTVGLSVAWSTLHSQTETQRNSQEATPQKAAQAKNSHTQNQLVNALNAQELNKYRQNELVAVDNLDQQMKRLDVTQLIREILSASQQQLDTLQPIPIVTHANIKPEPTLR